MTADELLAIRHRSEHFAKYDDVLSGGLADAQRDRAALLAHIDALTPRWQDGEPLADEWVWRETGNGKGAPVLTGATPDGHRTFCVNGEDFWFFWGTARWCPFRLPE